MKVGLIGSKGFIGSEICYVLKEEGCEILPILHNSALPDVKLDVVVNAGGNSKKYFAEENPYDDFLMNPAEVYRYATKLRYSNWIQISSVDVVDRNCSHYGFNKYLTEEILEHFCSEAVTFLRCSSVIGATMKKGLLFDIMMNKELRVSPESRLGVVCVRDVAKIVWIIIKNKYYPEKYIVSSVDTIGPQDMANILEKKVVYSAETRTQIYPNQCSLPSEIPHRTAEEHIKEVFHERVE